MPARPLMLCCVLAMFASPAVAQPTPEWLVLPTSSSSNVAGLEQAASTLTDALAKRASVWSRADAKASFELRHSIKPGSLTRSDIERWTERSTSALRNLARADYEAAQQDLVEAQQLTAGAIEELNRESEQARRLLDTCLFLARALFEGGHRDGAAGQVRTCRALSPKASPSEGKHTPETLMLLSEVDAERARQPLGKMFVDSVPRGCTVRLNGFDYGTTPRVLNSIIQGDYRVQVECPSQSAQRGRIYRVSVGAKTAQLRVDTLFDQVIATDPALGLTYPTRTDEETLRVRHATEVARVLGVRQLLLLSVIEPNALRIDRLEFDREGRRVVASVIVPAPLEDRVAESAVEALSTRASLDLRSKPATAIPTWLPPERRASSSPPRATSDASPDGVEAPSRARRAAGFALLGVAGAGMGASALAFVAHASDGRAFRSATLRQYLSRQIAWRDSRPLPYALMAPSAVAGIAGIALAVRSPGRTVPWWGWASGGVGLALLGAGVGHFALGGPCSRDRSEARTCARDQEHRDLGALLTLGAIPWLYLPAHQWLHRDRARALPVAVVTGLRQVAVHGSF